MVRTTMVSRRAVLSGVAASLAHSALLPRSARAAALLEDPRQLNHLAARDGYPGAFETEAVFAASSIPSDIEIVQTLGHTYPGDGGGHSKRRIPHPNPEKPWHNRSADGSWWEVVPEGPIDPIALGAVANGKAADGPALLAAAEFSRTFDVRISLRGGKTYLVTDNIALGKIKGICGPGTLKVSGSGANVRIGGSFGSGKTLALNARRRATSLRIAKHRLSPNQWIWIRSGENAGQAGSTFNPQLGDTGEDDVRYCEFARIDSVAGRDAVTLDDAIHYGYPQKSSRVFPVDFCSDAAFDDFTFDGSGQSFLRIEWSYNPFVSNSVKFINPGPCGLVLEHCVGGKVQGSYKRAAGTGEKSRPADYQAIKVRDGCYGMEISPRLVLNGEQGVDCTYGPSSEMNGVTRRIRVVNGTYIGINQQAITSHEGTEEIHIAHNLIKDGGDGVSVRGPNNRILNNVIRGRGSAPGNEAVRIGNAYANGNIVADNDIAHFEYGVRILGKGPKLPRNDTVRRNRIRDCRIGIVASRKSTGSLVEYGLRITENEIVDSAVSGIEVEDNLNGTILNHNVIRQESAGELTSPIRIGSGSNLEAVNNRAINCGAGIRTLSLSKKAKGRFERNASDGGTAKPRKAQPTAP